MRKGIVAVGIVLLALGVVVFLIAAIGANQAAADLLSCTSGFPMFGVPTACTNALNSLWTYQALEALGGVAGLIGIVLLVIGLVLPPERPAPVPTPYYLPPVYGPPPGYVPPQGPQSPPPQT